MAIFIDGITILGDAVVEPVSRTDAKTWMRVQYDDDNNLIDNLLTSARVHIENLTGLSLVNKLLKANIELTGEVPNVWMVDVPYGPLLCVDSIRMKTGMTSWQLLTKDDEYEVIGGKIWFYSRGYYEIEYQTGFSDLPLDLATDILTLVAWSYENRGKKFQGDSTLGLMKEYPKWDGLNYHQYKKVVI
jgi:hypothetical protein